MELGLRYFGYGHLNNMTSRKLEEEGYRIILKLNKLTFRVGLNVISSKLRKILFSNM